MCHSCCDRQKKSLSCFITEENIISAQLLMRNYGLFSLNYSKNIFAHRYKCSVDWFQRTSQSECVSAGSLLLVWFVFETQSSNCKRNLRFDQIFFSLHSHLITTLETGRLPVQLSNFNWLILSHFLDSSVPWIEHWDMFFVGETN